MTLAASVLIVNPVALFAAVVQINHGGDCVDTQAVCVVDLEPSSRHDPDGKPLGPAEYLVGDATHKGFTRPG